MKLAVFIEADRARLAVDIERLEKATPVPATVELKLDTFCRAKFHFCALSQAFWLAPKYTKVRLPLASSSPLSALNWLSVYSCELFSSPSVMMTTSCLSVASFKLWSVSQTAS